MNFLGMGPGELIVIMLLALVVFGPGKLPEIGAGLGKAIRQFRSATSEITQELNRELSLDSVLQDPPRQAAAPAAPAQPQTSEAVAEQPASGLPQAHGPIDQPEESEIPPAPRPVITVAEPDAPVAVAAESSAPGEAALEGENPEGELISQGQAPETEARDGEKPVADGSSQSGEPVAGSADTEEKAVPAAEVKELTVEAVPAPEASETRGN